MTTGKRQRRKYTKEFKQEAIALVTEQGYSISHAARSLDINTNMLTRWKQEREEQTQGRGVKEDERAELKRLRKENRELRMEKDILKKASAYFAKEMT